MAVADGGLMARHIDDPLAYLERARCAAKTTWLRTVYPFRSFGDGVSIHHSVAVSRARSAQISVGNNVYLGPDVWLNVVPESAEPSTASQSVVRIKLNDGCKVGRRSTISAKNSIELGEDVLLAPSILIMDHNHEYSDPNLPIHAQGVTGGGRIVIGRNSWLGYGSVVFCSAGELTLGHNCIVGANAVVTCSFPDCSVIAGNPARLLKMYNALSGCWERV